MTRPSDTVPAAMQLPTDADASGRTFGEEELALLAEVIRSGTLNSTRGTMVRRLEEEFAELHGRRHCVATTSGTSAIHTALAALDLPRGSEVVTTPITDMGGLTPILYEGCRPVFADVAPDTGNLTAETVEAAITPRTSAIVVVHLFGLPCDMKAIAALAKRRGLALIEDCAQAYLAEIDGQRVGTFGDVAAFSLQQGKHMSCGEGGLVLVDDDRPARRAALFVNKAWPYGEESPDHEFPALNYRMTELQGAVALAQLRKLEACVARRIESAGELHRLLEPTPGLVLPIPPDGFRHVYWRYCLFLDPEAHGDPDGIGRRLRERGIACVPRYIRKPAFECRSMRETGSFSREEFPGTLRMLERALVLPWNEAYRGEHVRFLGGEITRELSPAPPAPTLGT